MATTNPFDLLGDDDNDDPSQLIIAAQQQKIAPPPKKSPAPAQTAAAAQPAKPAKLPSKPLPPTQAVREARNEGQRGGGRGGGRGSGRGRGGGGFNRDLVNDENTFGNNNGFSGGYKPHEEGEGRKSSERRGYGGGPRGGFRGGRRGGFSNGEVAEGERPQRAFERRSGTGRGNEFKRDGSGNGNWGTPTDEITPETEVPVNENEKNVDAEKQLGQEDAGDANKKENPVNEPEEKEPEDKEMTLEEYEKVLEEKRKALLALKTKERKVNLDKELESMQLLSSKKDEHDIFIKLGSDKDKRKEAAEKEDRAKKSVSINEFLKPAEGERYYNPGGRGRGRGRGSRGGFGGGFGGSNMMNVGAPSIEDVGQFPSLGAK
uniref:Putative nuclear RNA-binding family protein n=1 Tax=Davidia involucrata TaxID=16924 RepID=A0A5B7BPJ7_DAVIN